MKRLVILTMAVSMMAACTKHTVVKPETEVVAADPITVLVTSHDPFDVQEKLERELLRKGFNVTSRLGDPAGRKQENPAGDYADYLVNARYDTRCNPFYCRLKTFNVNVVDTINGELVSSGSYKGKSTDDVLKNFVKALSRETKEYKASKRYRRARFWRRETPRPTPTDAPQSAARR